MPNVKSEIKYSILRGLHGHTPFSLAAIIHDHMVACFAGKFFWFALYTYLTLVYFTFFGECR